MNDLFLSSATLGVVISLIFYEIGLQLRKKFDSPFVNALLIAIVLTICFLLVTRVEYSSYMHSAQYLSYLLTPATVSLAIPLYEKIKLLKENLLSILISILAGCIASLSSILLFSVLFKFSHAEYVTFLPKSITTAIGMSVSEELGGNTSITVAVIIITGIFGNIIAESFLKLIKVKQPIARGLAIGTASHAIGTSKAMEMGEVEGAMSSLAIVISGIITVVLANLFVLFY